MPQGLDNRLLYAMRTRFHGPRREAFARGLAFLGEYGWIWLAIGVAMALLDSGQREEWIVAGLLGPFAIGLNYAVKLVVRRPRPVLDGLPPLGGAPSSLSFPSAHSTASFACATAMTRIDSAAAVLFVLAAADRDRPALPGDALPLRRARRGGARHRRRADRPPGPADMSIVQ